MQGTPKDINTIFHLLDYLGVKYQYTVGSEWVRAECPFAKKLHSKGTDNHPSFGIHIGNGFFHCFACKVKGYLYHFPYVYASYFGEDPKLKTILDRDFFIPKLFSRIKTRKPSFIKNIPFQKYRGPMFEKETVELFDLRYDPRRNRLVIPIRYYNAKVVSLLGRYLGEDPQQPRYLYYKEFGGTIPHGLGIWFGYHFPLNYAKPTLILTEGPKDVIRLKEAGVHNVWGAGGSEISKAQLETLRMTEIRRIVLFFDNDDAGKKAEKFLVDNLKNEFKFYKIKNYFGCKDAAEIVEQGLLKEALKSATEIGGKNGFN